MAAIKFYRGGSSLKPSSRDLHFHKRTGLLKTNRGVSVFNRPDNLDRHGGPHRVTNVPAELQIIQRGVNPDHFEIVPAYPMTLAEYEDALGKIVLVPE
jgi:hypothetical protein